MSKSALEKKLFREDKSAWDLLTKDEISQAYKVGEDYKKFLNENKSEREIVALAQKYAKKAGYVSIENATSKTTKVYAVNKEKNIVLINLGKGNLTDGFRIIGAHADTVRLDLKMSPVYESNGLAILNLHYYGGITKYQWLNLPMVLQGVILDKNGKKTHVSIGRKNDEPVFAISELAPHLEGRERADKKAREKEVTILEVESKGNEFLLKLKTSHGTYVKEFISGDEEKTLPNISSILKQKCVCKELSVLEILD